MEDRLKTDYQIETGVPIPKSRRRKWAFMEDMEVTNSFICPAKDRSSAMVAGRKMGYELKSKLLPVQEGYSRRVRIWRMS